jgi:hypothetical protein
MRSPSPTISFPRSTTLLSLYSVRLLCDSYARSIYIEKILAVCLPPPLIRAELEETACWRLDWANSEVIAVGTTCGESFVVIHQLTTSHQQTKVQ